MRRAKRRGRRKVICWYGLRVAVLQERGFVGIDVIRYWGLIIFLRGV